MHVACLPFIHGAMIAKSVCFRMQAKSFQPLKGHVNRVGRYGPPDIAASPCCIRRAQEVRWPRIAPTLDKEADEIGYRGA